MSVIDEIAAERRRQVEQEDWSAEHDDQHVDGSLAAAAACYAAPFRVFRAEEHAGRGYEPYTPTWMAGRRVGPITGGSRRAGAAI